MKGSSGSSLRPPRCVSRSALNHPVRVAVCFVVLAMASHVPYATTEHIMHPCLHRRGRFRHFHHHVGSGGGSISGAGPEQKAGRITRMPGVMMVIVSSQPTASCMSQLVEYREDPECAQHCTLKAPAGHFTLHTAT